jgi:uncharacterized protein YqhQ
MKDLLIRATRLLLLQEDVLLGGQAVLEGVMMRSPRSMAVAVRRPNGEISILRQRILALADMHPLLRLPVIRGAVVMVQALVLGFRSLNFSAETAFEEPGEADERQGAGEAPARTAGTEDSQDRDIKKKPGGSSLAIAGSLVLAVILGFGLFFLIPLALTQFVRSFVPALENTVIFNLVDGVIRVIIFLAYLFSISLMRDIRRVFEYHGAEHKTVHAAEARVPLTVENVRTYSRLHPRCGTSFLMFVMVVSILVFSFLPSDPPFYILILPRLALIPLIAGLSYEAIRLSARHIKNPVSRVLIRPGLWLQYITTQEPEDAQIAVAIRALEEALEGERAGGPEVVPA